MAFSCPNDQTDGNREMEQAPNGQGTLSSPPRREHASYCVTRSDKQSQQCRGQLAHLLSFVFVYLIS